MAKLMSNLDLIYAAQEIRVTAHCNTTIGLPGTLSCRLQPNHTTDDPDGIHGLHRWRASTFGAGDAVHWPQPRRPILPERVNGRCWNDSGK